MKPFFWRTRFHCGVNKRPAFWCGQPRSGFTQTVRQAALSSSSAGTRRHLEPKALESLASNSKFQGLNSRCRGQAQCSHGRPALLTECKLQSRPRDREPPPGWFPRPSAQAGREPGSCCSCPGKSRARGFSPGREAVPGKQRAKGQAVPENSMQAVSTYRLEENVWFIDLRHKKYTIEDFRDGRQGPG